METPERILRRLEFSVVRRLDGFLFGDYTGLFYGPSLDLAEVREYVPGDEVRRIDWNVTARTTRLHVRQYREEKELTAWLAVDLSPSMAFGTRRVLKRQLAAEFCGAASYIVTRHGDRVGAVFFPHRYLLPPRTGRLQTLRVLHLLQRLQTPPASGRTDLRGVLRDLNRMLRRRSLVFVVSDFLSPEGWEIPLRQLSHRHDVVAVRTTDPAESELPDVGIVTLQDPETGQQVRVNTSDPAVRRAYRQRVAQWEAHLQRTFRQAGVDVLMLSTHTSIVEPLVQFVAYRRRRRWSSRGR
ncbi:MAG: DUF58 domain-containing protein [candidate division GAL15 bacterium]